MTDRLLTARELADRLGVSTGALLRWTRAGQVPAVKLPSRRDPVRARADRRVAPRAVNGGRRDRGSVSSPGRRPPHGSILVRVSSPAAIRVSTNRGGYPMRAKGSSEGSVFETNDGYGIRWPENGKRPQKTGFRTKTEARRWFAENVAPRLGRGGPSSEITYDAFCEIFLARHGATVADSTIGRRSPDGSPIAASGSAAGRSASSRTPPRTLPTGGPSTTTVSGTGSRRRCGRRSPPRCAGST